MALWGENYSTKLCWTLIREAIIRSARGQAADIVCFLGTKTDLEKNISKLETTYGTVSWYDVLMQQFYGVHMEKVEKVQSYATRMEGSLNQIQVKFPRMTSDREAKIKSRDRLFYWVLTTLGDSIWYMYDGL